MVEVLALPGNVILGCKWLIEANTLAYYTAVVPALPVNDILV